MSKENAAAISTILAIVIFIASSIFAFNFSESQWHAQIAARRAHPIAGWKAHQGTIISAKPSQLGNITETPGVVRFADYYGRPQTVSLTFLKYPLTVGTHVLVDVNRNGSIYVPSSTTFNYDYQWNYTNNAQPWKGPQAATHGIWPVYGTIFGVFLSGILSILIDSISTAILSGIPNLRGRLGTR